MRGWAGRRSSSGQEGPRRAWPGRAQARRRSWRPPRRSRASAAAAPGTVGARSRSHCATRLRTSENPLACSPLDARPTIASPARAAVPSISRSRSTTPTQQPARSNDVGSISPGCSAVSPPMMRTTRFSAAGGDAADELRGLRRVEPSDGHVVEEEERFGAAADDVVGAHRDEVDADRVVASERRRDRRLGPDPVGRRDENRLPVTRGDRDRPTEATEPAEHLRPPRALDGGPHELDGTIRRRRRRRPRRRRRSGDLAPSAPLHHTPTEVGGGAPRPHPSEVSSRMNFRDATSYGTGSG